MNATEEMVSWVPEDDSVVKTPDSCESMDLPDFDDKRTIARMALEGAN